VVAVQGTAAPALISTNCDSLSGWTPLWMSCYSAMAPGTFYEKSEIRRSVYDRIVNAAITVAISAAIAMHDRWSFK
jgi:hypothetical protein